MNKGLNNGKIEESKVADHLITNIGGQQEMRTLSNCIKEWMETTKRISVKPLTYDRLETSYRSLLEYPIAKKPVSSLTTADMQSYINTLAEEGYSLSTIKKQYHLVGAYISYANGEGIQVRPICNNVSLPSPSQLAAKDEGEIQSYSKAEQILLKRVLKTGDYIGYYAALLMMETGLRVGECLALKWEDVLWNRKALRVNKTLIRMAHRKKMEVQIGAKSHTSNRLIPLSTEALNLLSELLETTKNPIGYIFSAEDDFPISYEAIRYQITKACKIANVPYKGQHAFRHTFATNCYYNGADVKILSKLLGHSKVSITYDIYIHLFGDALEEMRSVIG